MILIADSGSSKTDWLLIENGERKNIETKGINPFFQNTEEIYEMLKDAFDNEMQQKVTEVFFYGAGCIANETDYVVADALRQLFPAAKVDVQDDMLGAARALLGQERGIACILGTGANSCKYDGQAIEDKVPTLGFILGDEGSGAYLGKVFLNDYFKRAIPVDLKVKIDKDLQLEWPKVLKAVYKEEFPSRFLASFSRFYKENIAHPYVRSLIKSGFEAFITKNVERYTNFRDCPIGFVGSIAFHYSDILEEVLAERGLRLGRILVKPVVGLAEYHRL